MDLFLIPLCYDVMVPETNSNTSQFIINLVNDYGVRKTMFNSEFFQDVYSRTVNDFDIDKFLEDIQDPEFVDKAWKNVDQIYSHVDKIDEVLSESFKVANQIFFKEFQYVLARYPILLDRNHLLAIKEFKGIGQMSPIDIGTDLFNSNPDVSYLVELAKYLIQLFLGIKIIDLTVENMLQLSQRDYNIISNSLQIASQKMLMWLPAFFP